MTRRPQDWKLEWLRAGGGTTFHRIACRVWGKPEAGRAVVCVHGLTRNAGDFDVLAQALSADHYVICPDMPGRGQSEWLSRSQDYNYGTYVSDMIALLAKLDVAQVDWIGTSMGGVVGMQLAAFAGSPIRRLVLNDVGPFTSAAVLGGIRQSAGEQPVFEDMAAATRYFRARYASVGPLSDAQWHKLTADSVRATPGGLTPNFDPAIATALPEIKGDVEMWPLWSRIACPVLVLRGGASQVLTAETQERMQASHPGTRAILVPEAGHAPALVAEDQVRAIRDWLGSDIPIR